MTLFATPTALYVPPGDGAVSFGSDKPQVLRVEPENLGFVSINIPGPQGPPGASAANSWINYAANYDPASPPVFLETIAEGDVYQYTYANGTLYRVVGSTTDAFYQTFVSPNVSDLVTARATTI